jgi:hypothetical protein
MPCRLNCNRKGCGVGGEAREAASGGAQKKWADEVRETSSTHRRGKELWICRSRWDGRCGLRWCGRHDGSRRMRTGRQSAAGARRRGCDARKSLPTVDFRGLSFTHRGCRRLVSLANSVVNLARDKGARGEPSGGVAVNGVGAGVCGPLSLAAPLGGCLFECGGMPSSAWACLEGRMLTKTRACHTGIKLGI